MTDTDDERLDSLGEIYNSINLEQHLQFLNIDPQKITAEEIQFDRSGRLQAWSQLQKIVCSVDDLKAHKDGLAFVGILGHFTAGKSTLINAIVGNAEQRAADPNPTDKTITLICHPDNLTKLRTNSFTSIEGVGIEPGPPVELLRNIVLVDTPGLGNNEAEHDMAERFLHLCHVIIVTVDGMVPLADTAGNLSLLDKAINRLGDVPKIFAITKSANFLSDRKGEYETHWDQKAADQFWMGVKSRMTSDPRFATAVATIESIPAVFVDSKDDFNIDKLKSAFVPITQDTAQGPRTYRAQVTYIVQIASEALRTFNSYLVDRLSNLNALYSEAKRKADEAKNMLARRQDSVISAIETATEKIDEIREEDYISQAVLPIPEPSEFLLSDRFGDFHAAINQVTTQLRDIENSVGKSVGEVVQQKTRSHFRLFFASTKSFDTEELVGYAKSFNSNLQSLDKHNILIAINIYFEKAHEDIVWMIRRKWTADSLGDSAKSIRTVFTAAYQALAGGLGSFIESYNIAARAFVAYLAQPTSKKLLAEYGVVLFNEDDESLELEAAELENSDFESFSEADKAVSNTKTELSDIVGREQQELSKFNVPELLDELRVPVFEYPDFIELHENCQQALKNDLQIFLSDSANILESSTKELKNARAICMDGIKEIWLGWFEFSIKIAVIWVVLFGSLFVIKQNDIQIYDWLNEFAIYGWQPILFSVVGAAIFELFKFVIKRNNDFVSPTTFSFGLRPLIQFAKKRRRVRSTFDEGVRNALKQLNQRLRERPLEVGKQIHRVLENKFDVIVKEAGGTDLRAALIGYREERVGTYQRGRQAFINATNSLRKELGTVSESKGKESVDRVLDRISDTQESVTEFSEQLQDYGEQLSKSVEKGKTGSESN